MALHFPGMRLSVAHSVVQESAGLVSNEAGLSKWGDGAGKYNTAQAESRNKKYCRGKQRGVHQRALTSDLTFACRVQAR